MQPDRLIQPRFGGRVKGSLAVVELYRVKTTFFRKPLDIRHPQRHNAHRLAIIRPLAKSVCQLEIADPCDQAEVPPAVAVPFRKYAKTLHEPYLMLVARASARKLAVSVLVLRAQRALFQQLAVAAQLSHALVPAVQQQLGAGQKARERLLEEAEVVCPSGGEGHENYQPVGFPHYDLRFHGVPLLLARIVLALFFLGRSTGVSVAAAYDASVRVLTLLGGANQPTSVRRQARRELESLLPYL